VRRVRNFLFLLILGTFLLTPFPLSAAQHPDIKKVTAEDYAFAEKFLSKFMNPLVFGSSVRPNWIDDSFFWYRNTIPEGFEFVLVDMKKKIRTRAFDHKKLAISLSKAAGKEFESFKLPFQSIEFSDRLDSLTFEVDSIQYTYLIKKDICTKGEKIQRADRNLILSPNGKLGAFIRDNNLWIKNLTTEKEIQLTTDGMEDFGYGTNNAGWTKSTRPVLLWSPDSKKIATFQHDGRGVGEMYLVSTNVGHPTLEAWKYPLPEDKEIFRIHRVVIHVDGPRVVRLQMPPDQHRSTITDHIAYRGALADAEWSSDSSQLAFVSVSRDHKHVVLRMTNPETGVVRDVLEEKVDTFFESGFGSINWHILPETNEVIWFSQRDNWGHLYLYDLISGQVKNQITKGNWNVLQLVHMDLDNRVFFFTGAGREPGDPYFQYFYCINMDGTDLKLLTPNNANHTVYLSPSGQYFVDSYSTPVEPPSTELRDMDGKKLLKY